MRTRGKGAALETGAARLAVLEAARTGAGGEVGAGPWVLLLVDADLGATAVNTLVLTGPVLAGEADMTIAVLPPQARPGGGRGLVVNLSRRGIVRATGWTPTQPLSGMRCLTREAFEAARPLAHGWGVETALTIDLLTAGYRVVEVPCDLQHRVTGSDWHGQLHRAPAVPGRRPRPRRPARAAGRARCACCAGSRCAAPRASVPVAGCRRARAGTRPRPRAGAASVVLLAGTAALGESAAVPPVGPRTWTPPWDLAAHPSPVLVTLLLWMAAGLGAAAVALGLRAVAAGARLRPRTVAAAALVAVGLLVAVPPLGSADHLSYAAYGRIAAQGGDPYAVPPITWRGGTDPVAGAVQPPWQDTPSVYGPVATGVMAAVSALAGSSLRLTVWLWQLVCGLAFLAVALVLDRCAGPDPGRRARVAVLWTLNPLLLGQLVLGAHVDVLAAALAVGGLAAGARRPLLAGALFGAATATKAPYALFALAALWPLRHVPRAPGGAGSSAPGPQRPWSCWSPPTSPPARTCSTSSAPPAGTCPSPPRGGRSRTSSTSWPGRGRCGRGWPRSRSCWASRWASTCCAAGCCRPPRRTRTRPSPRTRRPLSHSTSPPSRPPSRRGGCSRPPTRCPGTPPSPGRRSRSPRRPSSTVRCSCSSPHSSSPTCRAASSA